VESLAGRMVKQAEEVREDHHDYRAAYAGDRAEHDVEQLKTVKSWIQEWLEGVDKQRERADGLHCRDEERAGASKVIEGGMRQANDGRQDAETNTEQATRAAEFEF
jgi:hypothetical protein